MSTPPQTPSDNQPKDQLFHHRRGPREFLLYQIQVREAYDPEAQPAPPEDQDLADQFPDLLTGETFQRAALDQMEPYLKFGVLAVRVDASPRKTSETDTVAANGHNSSEQDSATPSESHVHILATAQAIEQISSPHKGIWGRWDGITFGLFLPRADRTQCLEVARSVRQNLTLRQKTATVSIGIGLFPTVNFPRTEIMGNALKALDHAAFFGPDSTVPFDAVTLNVSGDQLYQQNDVVGAIRELKLALMLDPSNVNVHNSLGVCYAEKQSWDLAQESFETARWLDPEDAMAVYNLGLIHMFQKQHDQAVEYFRGAVEIDDEMFEAYVQLGRLLLQKGRAAEARPFLERAVEINPETAPPHRFLAQCLEKLALPEEAIAAYRRAVKCNPQDGASLSALGYLLDQAGENLEITTLFCRQGVELAPREGLYRYRLGQLYLKGAKPAQALAQFEKALELGYAEAQAQIAALKEASDSEINLDTNAAEGLSKPPVDG